MTAVAAPTTWKTASLLLTQIYREYMFTEPLLKNVLHNPVVLLVRALLSNGK
jgi:hypothetical protein